MISLFPEQNYILIAGGWENDYHLDGDHILAEIDFTTKEDTSIQDAVGIDQENTQVAGGYQSTVIDGDHMAVAIENPLGTESLTELLENIYNYVVDFAIAISSIIIVWAGYLFLSAGGDKEKIEKAKRLLTWAVIGLAVSILAKGIALVIKNILVGG